MASDLLKKLKICSSESLDGIKPKVQIVQEWSPSKIVSVDHQLSKMATTADYATVDFTAFPYVSDLTNILKLHLY